MEEFLNKVINSDSITGMENIPTASVHLILSDIPYGIGKEDWDILHDNRNSAFLGTSPAQKKAGAIFKKRGKPINGWSEADRNISREYYDWCSSWAKEWLRVIKPGGSVFIFAGRRYSHRCISALEDAGFNFKDMLSWMREKAPLRAQRVSIIYERRGDLKNANKWEGWRVGNLRPTFEPILWFTKPYKIGTTIADNIIEFNLGAFNEKKFRDYQPRSENVLNSNFGNNEQGKHPTQKPLDLMRALIELTTIKSQVVLDPFCGSGSTLVAAKSLERKYIGFEINEEYAKIAQERLNEGIDFQLKINL